MRHVPCCLSEYGFGPMSDRQRGARRKWAARAAFLLFFAALLVAVDVFYESLDRLIIAILEISIAATAVFVAITRRGWTRFIGWAVAAGAFTLLVLLVIDVPLDLALILLMGGLVYFGADAARYALRLDAPTLEMSALDGVVVGPARHGVLIMNPRSGGGKLEEFDLANEARRRGIEPIVLKPGDDLRRLAEVAIEEGADVLGMAGGDGSQALVAGVAARQNVAYVCVPAGTRNHLAQDLGLDRTNVIGALDAFTDAVERRIDLAKVGDQVFVNNVSMGVYARVLQSDEYRAAKRQTALAMLPDLLGPEAESFDLRFDGPDGVAYQTAHVILVSNNPYQLTQIGGRATRARMDTGLLGIVIMRIDDPSYVAEMVALETAGQIARFRGLMEWTDTEFTLDSGQPIEVGIDGEALVLERPLEFKAMPGALRVRLPHHAGGLSPAAIADASRISGDNFGRLWAVARGQI